MFPLGITEYEEIEEDFFKYFYTYQDSSAEIRLLSANRERTPENFEISSRFFENKPKTRPELVTRRKKPPTKKAKKKKRAATNDANNINSAKTADQLEKEFYKKVISKKIPVFTNPRNTANNTLLTRRQLTEEKIIENVRRYGDPADRIDYTGLCVVDESLYYEELAKLRGSNSII